MNNHVETLALDATSVGQNRLEKHPVGVAVIATVIALALTGTHYVTKTRNNDAAISSMPGSSPLSSRNDGSISSLAVMPFRNVNADHQKDYLSDGTTEMLIRNLSQLPGLNVKARASVFSYKGKDVSPQTLGGDLNVQVVLNGRITLVDDALTLSLELADAQTDDIIWTKQYLCKQTELAALKSEIALNVLDKLRLKLSGADEQRLSKKYTPDPEAYDLYLKGRFYSNKRTLKDHKKSLEYFDRAISHDPAFALAYAGRADTNLALPFYSNEPAREAMLKAREDALKALSLDDDLAEPHVALADVFTREYDFAAAEREYQRAIYLNPNYAIAHQWYGILLLYLSRHAEASAEFRKASENDPLSPIAKLDYAESLLYERRYDDAAEQLKKTLELDTEFATNYRRLVSRYSANRTYDEATRSYAKCREFNGDRPRGELISETLAKRDIQCRQAASQLDNLSRSDVVGCLTALVEKDGGLAELNKFYEVFGSIRELNRLQNLCAMLPLPKNSGRHLP